MAGFIDYRLMQRGFDAIRSCVTVEQLDVAWKYAQLAMREGIKYKYNIYGKTKHYQEMYEALRSIHTASKRRIVNEFKFTNYLLEQED